MEETSYSVLKIFASSTDHVGQKLLYEYLVEAARDFGISGASVYRGIMGYGSSSKINSSRFWELTEKLPVVIEMVDESAILETFYIAIQPVILSMPKGCLVTLQPVSVLLNKKGGS